jgi:RNA polymerase sigma factor (sigma-70 family)
MSCTRAKNGQVSSTFQLYMREIRVESLLTAVEEKELAAAIACGDKDALARMIRANLLLVVTIARFYLGRGLAFDDLVGEGNLGLIRAAKDFQPRFGTRFSTYAAYWIRQSIRHALINTTATIRLPAYIIRQITKFRRAERALTLESGNVPNYDEVASVLGLTETQKRLMANAFQALRVNRENRGALEKAYRSADYMWNLGEERQVPVDVDDEHRVLMQRMQRLDERERTILELRYGLVGDVTLTLMEIGRRLGMSREWVRRIERQAIRKLGIDAVDAGRRFRWTGSVLTSPAPPRPERVCSPHGKLTSAY